MKFTGKFGTLASRKTALFEEQGLNENR